MRLNSGGIPPRGFAIKYLEKFGIWNVRFVVLHSQHILDGCALLLRVSRYRAHASRGLALLDGFALSGSHSLRSFAPLMVRSDYRMRPQIPRPWLEKLEGCPLMKTPFRPNAPTVTWRPNDAVSEHQVCFLSNSCSRDST